MKFDKIEELLVENSWYKIDEEERYLSTGDIFLGFQLGVWEDIPLEDVSENLISFMTLLGERVNVGSIRKVKVEFNYKNIKLQSLDLYLFSGFNFDRGTQRTVNIYFTVPSNYKTPNKIGNLFHISLIKYFNDDYSQLMIKHAIREIE